MQSNETFPPFPDAPPVEPVSGVALPVMLQTIFQWLITLLLPAVLILGSVRLVMSEQFLKLEYNRPGFPEDLFGFTTEDRLHYGPYGIHYLLDNKDISYLAELMIDGEPAFQRDELRHMEDVQSVTRTAFQFLALLGAIFVISIVFLIRRRATHPRLWLALRRGGLLTLALVIIAGLLVVIAWGFFFDSFHEVFFAEGTWQFSRSDTLIRLYPEQFWFDATITIVVLTLLGAVSCIGISWYWRRRVIQGDSTVK